MSAEGKTALVTGAAGFIGSHLVEALVRSGAKVRALVRYNSRGAIGHLETLDADVLRQVEVIAGDVRDRTLVRNAVQGCPWVLHLAALIGIPYSYHAVQSYVETNVGGTMNILEAARECGVQRLVCTSTSEVYGTAQYTPIDERHPLHAQSPYAATKIGADQLAGSYHAAFGLPVVLVRPFNTFGPRQSARAVIPTIITQALTGDTIRLGSTGPVRDFVFVQDTAAGFIAAAEAPDAVGEVFNLATGRGVSIGQVVDMVGERLGRRLRVITSAERERPTASEVLRLEGSAEKAAHRLGWTPRVSWEEGLDRTIAWIDAHRGQYRAELYSI